MGEESTGIGSEPTRLSAASLPEGLLREMFSLAAILGVTLILSGLERNGWIPWPGNPSSLTLLLLGLWHRRRFHISLRLLPVGDSRWALPIIVAVGLAVVLLFTALAPLWLQTGQQLPFIRGFHLLFLVPLSEEFYFRGLLLDHLRRGFSALSATVLCSLLFALLHLPSGAIIEAGLLSLVACVLVLKSGSLGYALQLHVAWNGVAEINNLGDSSERWYWSVFTAAIIVLIAMARLRRPGRPLANGSAP